MANLWQCVIIGKDAKDVSEEDALDYVAAYTCGNDVSSRKLQRDPAFAGGVSILSTLRVTTIAEIGLTR